VALLPEVSFWMVVFTAMPLTTHDVTPLPFVESTCPLDPAETGSVMV
jgi:hypothetical protein